MPNKINFLLKPTNIRKFVYILAIGLVISLLFINGNFSPAKISKAYGLATTHKQEAFTELYLVNHRAIPTSAPVGKPVTFSFVIANHEARHVNYTYTVSSLTAGSLTLIATGTVSLDNNTSTTRQIIFSSTVPRSQSTITIRLIGRPQQVNFKVES